MRLNIKQKLLLLLFSPLSFILFMFALLIDTKLTNKRNLEETKIYLTEVQCLSKIIHALQMERGVSVYYRLYQSHQVKENLAQVRHKVDVSIQSCQSKKLDVKYSPTGLVLKDFEQIEDFRDNINDAKLTKNEILERYSQLISKLQKRVKLIPTLIKDVENSTYINAYNFLLNAREALGKMRAILLEGFIDRHNIEDVQNIYYLKNDFQENMEDFELILSKEFVQEYESKLKDKHIVLTMKILNEVIYDKNYQINVDIWFETITKSIDTVYEIESMLFTKVNELIENKIDAMLLRIYSLNAF
jgi:hypothetical protein